MQQPRRRLQRASFTAYQLNSTTVCQPHRESKNKTLNSCPILLQMLTDFKNSFTDKLTDKFAITKKPYVNIPPHLRYIATLPCEIWKSGNWTCMKLHMSSEHVLSNGAVHSARTELKWPATSRPSYTTRWLVTRVSVTTGLAAAKLGRLVLSQFVCCGTLVLECTCSELDCSVQFMGCEQILKPRSQQKNQT